MIEREGDGLRVSGPMLISNASALLKAGRGILQAMPAAAAGQAAAVVVLDLKAVGETDSSALGVVFGLLRTARERGAELRVVNPPASLLSQAALYGVAETLSFASSSASSNFSTASTSAAALA